MASQNSPSLTSFKALSFDCYGTLVDWVSGLSRDLERLFIPKLPHDHPYKNNLGAAYERLGVIAGRVEETQPRLTKDKNLSLALSMLADENDIVLDEEAIREMGQSPRGMAAFPDTVSGLQILKRHYKLMILTNMDNASAGVTTSKHLAPVVFDAVYTAEDIGSYKPTHANFNHMWDRAKADLGVDGRSGEVLHVARSLNLDHVPCKELGARSVWISREVGAVDGGLEKATAEYEGRLAFEWRFDSIGDFAKEVERQFAAADASA